MSKKQRAFSLVEVTLAIGVIAFGVIAIVGLMPVGIQASKDAADDTRTSVIAQDAWNRTRALLTGSFPALSGSYPSETQMGPKWFYDVDGRFLDQTNGPNYPNVLFVAQVKFGPLQIYPSAGTIGNATLTGATVSIGWPVNGTDGTISQANASRAVYSFYLHNQ